MPLLNQAFFIGLDKVGNIVEVLDIIPSISFWAIPDPAYKVFDSEAPTFFDYAFIKKTLYFKGFVVVSITFHKCKKGILWTGVLKQILGQAWSWLKLSYKKNKMDLLVTQYIQLVGKATNSLNNLERANVLLDQLFYYSNKGKN